MFIHTVVQGENLRRLAEIYGTTSRELLRINEIEDPDRISPGLHLLVPGGKYTAVPYQIQQGTTLEQIASQSGFSVEAIQRWTGIRSETPTLQEGTRLYVPKTIRNEKSIEVNAFMIPEGTVSDSGTIRDIHTLTYVSIFSFNIKEDGSLDLLRDADALQGTDQVGARPIMTVTNFDGQQFNRNLASTVLTNATLRRKTITSIMSVAKERDYSGVIVDFENMSAAEREPLNRFVKELSVALRAERMLISVVVGPKTSNRLMNSPLDAYDYKSLAADTDFLVLMTYEWGWVGGPPPASKRLQGRRCLCY